MSTKLKGLYRSLHFFQVATQGAMCDDLTRRAKTLADWFAEALKQNSSFDNLDQPFLNQSAIDARVAIRPDVTDVNRVIALLEGRETVGVDQGPDGYLFRYIQREVPPLRREKLGARHSGAGGIDYIARTDAVPILGEVKVDGDQNAFYAFVQLLNYLSEMATPKQIERANRHLAFGESIGDRPTFDLHILLADRNTKSKKELLVEPTKVLAATFRRELVARHLASASVLGRILCLTIDTARFRLTPERGISCQWFVE